MSTMEYFEEIQGLAERVTDKDGQYFPGINVNGELVNVDFDTRKTKLFFMLDGDIQRTTEEDKFVACQYRINEVYNLKVFIYSQGKEDVNCSSFSQRLAWIVSKAITGKHKSLMDATGIDFVLMQTASTVLDKNSVWSELYSAPSQLKDDDILAKVNIRVEIEGNEICFVPYPCTVAEVLAAENSSIIQPQKGSLIEA